MWSCWTPSPLLPRSAISRTRLARHYSFGAFTSASDAGRDKARAAEDVPDARDGYRHDKRVSACSRCLADLR